MNDLNTDSSSGEISASFVNISDVFTQYTEIPTSGFNVLYKAQRFGKWFVIKGLKEEFRNSAVHRELLAKEFAMGILLSQENIVQFYNKETDPVAGDCIVMEYVDGETLSAFLKTNPPRRVREKIARQLLGAMAYYQGLQIVHRDLKPENILITRNGNNVKIIDFGLSDTDTSAVLKQPAGSPKYMAPEQRNPDIEIDGRADLYSFAIILQTLFSSLPRGWRKVERRCAQPDRENRPVNAAEALLLLQQAEKRSTTSLRISVIIALITLLVLAFSLLTFQQQETATTPTSEVRTVEVPADTPSTSTDFSPAGTTTLVHDTIIQYKEKAEITDAMKQFICQQMKTQLQPFWTNYAQYEKRVQALLNGEKGNAEADLEIYDKLSAAYTSLAANINHEIDNKMIVDLKKQFPDAQYADSYDIHQQYALYYNKFATQIGNHLIEIHTAIGKYDVP